ncbi:MAG: cupredoxin domain-containing protein [Dehalococcoidia bacterium]
MWAFQFRRIAALGSLGVIAIGIACNGNDVQATPTQIVPVDPTPTEAASSEATPTQATSQPTATSTAPDASEVVRVSIAQFAFSPATLTVDPGTRVEWTNQDDVPHTATLNDVFDTDNITTGDSGSHVFDTPGTFDYICALHPDMTGTVIVR